MASALLCRFIFEYFFPLNEMFLGLNVFGIEGHHKGLRRIPPPDVPEDLSDSCAQAPGHTH